MRLAYPQYAARLDNAKEPEQASQPVRYRPIIDNFRQKRFY